MIKSIFSSDPYVVCNSYSPPFIGNTNQMAGQMRLNTSTQNVEVYDGYQWISISQTSSIELSSEAQTILNWARTKMIEETSLKEKMEKHPTLRAAYEQYKMVEALVYEEDKNEKS